MSPPQLIIITACYRVAFPVVGFEETLQPCLPKESRSNATIRAKRVTDLENVNVMIRSLKAFVMPVGVLLHVTWSCVVKLLCELLD